MEGHDAEPSLERPPAAPDRRPKEALVGQELGEVSDELIPESRERVGEEMPKDLERSLRDDPHLEGLRGHHPS